MKYPFEVFRMAVEGHEFWAAESKSLKGCVAQGDTLEKALEELELNEEEWMTTALEFGIAIPEVPFEKGDTFSGKFTVRVSPDVHQAAAEQAKKQGISLNQYVNDAIVTKNTENVFAEGIKYGMSLPKHENPIEEMISGGMGSWDYSYGMIRNTSKYSYKGKRG